MDIVDIINCLEIVLNLQSRQNYKRWICNISIIINICNYDFDLKKDQKDEFLRSLLTGFYKKLGTIPFWDSHNKATWCHKGITSIDLKYKQ